MTEFRDVVELWDAAAHDDDLRRAAIHPTGLDDAAYLESGRVRAAEVLRLAPPRTFRRIGDFGCGDGRVCRFLPRNANGEDKDRDEYVDVWAVDVSGLMLDNLPDEEPDRPLRMRRSSGLDGNLPTLNCWYTSAVFIHHSFADGARLLSALAEHTTKGGRILLDVPIYDEARERATWNDVTVWSREQFFDVVDSLGLTVTHLADDEGRFSFQKVGPNHAEFSVLDRR